MPLTTYFRMLCKSNQKDEWTVYNYLDTGEKDAFQRILNVVPIKTSKTKYHIDFKRLNSAPSFLCYN